MALKPICVGCQRFYRPLRNGAYFTESKPVGGLDRPALPGLAEPHNWEPYKVWVGDLWGCPTCGAEIIVGVAREPITQDYQPDFLAKRERLDAHQPERQINDC